MPDAVLIVEDESLVRMNIANELEDIGYRVLEAVNADDALKLVADEAVDVLFSDVDMPGSIDGLALASLIRCRFPHMPIILVSGHMAVAAGQLPTNSEFLTKPYMTHQVVDAIERQRRSYSNL